jgi:hypothetical protein
VASNKIASLDLDFLNTPSFATDSQKIGYAISLLSGNAKDWATTLLQRKGIPEINLTLNEWKEFLRWFSRFEDPWTIEKNNNKILGMSQLERESVSTYWNRFSSVTIKSVYAKSQEFTRPALT